MSFRICEPWDHRLSKRGSHLVLRIPVDVTSSCDPVYTERHRGISIFVLSCFRFCCQITAVIAIVMAMNDLPKIKRGTMDPRGEYLTTTGLVLAVVTLILTLHADRVFGG